MTSNCASKFKRFVSWLVLVCFYFQTLWPSVIFAADMEVIRPDSPSAFFGSVFSAEEIIEKERGVAFEIQIDDKNEDFSVKSRTSLPFIPLVRSLEETQKLIDTSLSLQSLYPGLKIQTDGLAWEQLGYSFFFHASGNLLVSGKGDKASRSSVLRLYNPYGSVVLGENLALDHLLVKAANVLHHGHSSINRLDVWAESSKGVTGRVINLKEASLSIKDFCLHQGQAENRGTLFVTKDGLMDLKGHDFINYGDVNFASGSRLINARLFCNLSSINGSSYSIRSQFFQNAQTIKGDVIRLWASQDYTNTGIIHSSRLTEVIGLKDFENTGTMISDRKQTLIFQGNFLNTNTIAALIERVKVLGITKNKGVINGKSSLSLDLNGGLNEGDIFSEGRAKTIIRGPFLNQKKFGAKGKHKLTLGAHFINALEAIFFGERILETLGEGSFENIGVISSTELMTLGNRSVINHNLIEANGALTLALREKFTNKNTGSVTAKGLTIIEGHADIENGGVSGVNEGISLQGGVWFKDYQGELINKGIFKSAAGMKGVLRKLRNSGVFQADKGFENLTIAEFFTDTTGSVIGEGKVRLKGINRGRWSADSLVLDLIGEFSHEQGLLAIADSLTVSGASKFVVGGEIIGLKVFVNNNEFENFSEWIQDKMEVRIGSHVKTWRNGDLSKGNKRAAIVVKTLTFEKSLLPESVRINEGKLITPHFCNRHQSFRNNGTMTLTHWQQQGSGFINQKEGSLQVTDLTDFDMDHFETEGEITLAGVIKGRIDQIHNKGKITLENSATLRGVKLLNEGSFKALKLFDWKGEVIDNSGQMMLFDNQAYANQIINRCLIRWTHNNLRALYLLNLGYLERTDQFEAPIPHFEIAKDQSSTFRKGMFENRGTIKTTVPYKPRVDTPYEWDFLYWLNKGALELQHLQTRSETFDNYGTIFVKEDLISEGGVFNDRGTINVNGKTVINGKYLNLLGNFTSEQGFSYEGAGFYSSSGMELKTKGPLRLVLPSFYDTLTLRGTIESEMGAYLSAYHIVNESQFGVTRGTTILNLSDYGDFTNTSLFKVTRLQTEGTERITNKGGQIEIDSIGPGIKWIENLPKESEKSIEAQKQTSYIQIGSGELKPELFINHSRFEMKNGRLEVSIFDNADGYLSLDSLSFWSHSRGAGKEKYGRHQNLSGVIQANLYSDYLPLDELNIYGIVKILVGDLKVKSLSIAKQGVFSLGRGEHRFEGVKNLGTLVTLDGMELTTDVLKNSGVIESSGNLHFIALKPSMTPKNPLSGPKIRIANFKNGGIKTPGSTRKLTNQSSFGTLKTKGDLVLELASFMDIAYNLHRFGDRWQHAGALWIYGDKFYQESDITHAGKLRLEVKKYKNPRYKLQANSLVLRVEELFELGESSSVYGTIETLPDPKITTKQDNDLIIVMRNGDLNLPYAHIAGEGLTRLWAQKGRVSVGEGIQEWKTHAWLSIEEFCKAPPLCQNHDAYGRDYTSLYSRRNGTFVSSNDALYIWGRDGVSLNHTHISAESWIELESKSPTADIQNLSSKIETQSHLLINGHRYVHTQLPPYRASKDEADGVWHFWQEYPQSDRAEIASLGQIHFNVHEIYNYAGIIKGIGGIFDGSSNSHAEGRPLEILRSDDAAYRVGCSFRDDGLYCIDTPQMVSGKHIQMSPRKSRQSSYLSAQTIILRGDTLAVIFIASMTSDRPTAGVHSTAYAIQGKVTEHGLIVQKPDGTIGYTVSRKGRSYGDSSLAPVVGQKNLGFKSNALLYAHPNLSDSAVYDLMLKHLGRVYHKGLTSQEMIDFLLDSGRHYGGLGMLESPESIRKIPEVVMFFREMTYQNIPLMVLEVYFPESEIEPDAGRSATLKAIDTSLTFGHIEMVRARLKNQHDVNVTTTQSDLNLLATQIKAGHDATLISAQDTRLQSLARREGNAYNYADEIDEASVEAGHVVTIDSERDNLLKAARTSSGVKTWLNAGRNTLDEALALASGNFHYHPGGGGYTRERRVHQHVSTHTSSGEFLSTAEGVQDIYAHRVEAPKVTVVGKQGVRGHEVHDSYEYQNVSNKGSRGFLGGSSSSKTETLYSEAKSKGPTYISDVVSMASMGNIDLTHITCVAPKVILASILGEVAIHSGTDYASYVRTSQGSGLLFQSRSILQEFHRTHPASKFSDVIEIHAGTVSVESVRGQTLEWINRIQLHGAAAINHILLDELHHVESHSVRGPTAAFGAVIALAVTIATQSAGASLLGTTGVLSSAMANAAFSSLCSQAALSLANNGGDFGKAAKYLTTTDAFKSLATSVATAGLSETGLGRAAAGFAVDVATGKRIDEAALSAARVAVASTLQASVAKHIGAGGFDPFTKAALHGISGAGTGAMLSENAEEGAISGGLSSMVATTVANFIKEDPNIIGERAVAKAKADGSSLDKASLQPYVQAELRATIDISRLSAAVATLFAGYDVNVGIETATTAVINNCAATMERQVFETSALKEALQEAVDAGKVAAADAMDKTADYIEEHPEVIEAGAHVLMGMGGVMAGDRGTKAPKIRSKGQAKADRVLAKGYASAAKPLAKGLRAAAQKMRGNKAASASVSSRKGKTEQRPLLPGEGKVGTYEELKKYKTRNDNLARHHIPNDQYMNYLGVQRDKGVSMMVEHPIPGTGGRHREIHKQLQRQDLSKTPRSALAQATLRARHVYKHDGAYTPEIRKGLQKVVEQNKDLYPNLFKK
ncbi:MAG: DUF637 domain-containing protein [Alphaproteobacteria bacterium]|nr:DUF637 domain-containing protein [Alphaproteobacteria bacterium]